VLLLILIKKIVLKISYSADWIFNIATLGSRMEIFILFVWAGIAVTIGFAAVVFHSLGSFATPGNRPSHGAPNVAEREDGESDSHTDRHCLPPGLTDSPHRHLC
jgi:hypothetical protein